MSAIFLRDVLLAVRAGGGFGLALVFFLIVVVLVPLGIGPDPALLTTVAPGVLWIAALLASLLALDRLFAIDREDGALDLIATSPVPLEAVALAKAAAHWATTGLPLAVAAPVAGVLLNLSASGSAWMAVSLLLGTPALSMIGTFGAALTVGLKRGGALLAVLVLPLYLPTLIFGTQAVLQGEAGQGPLAAVLLTLLVTLLALAILPFATAAALRINLR